MALQSLHLDVLEETKEMKGDDRIENDMSMESCKLYVQMRYPSLRELCAGLRCILVGD